MDSHEAVHLINKQVSLRVSDIEIPSPEEVINELYGKSIVEGKVIDLTYSGKQKRVFLVVQVEGINDFVIVPLEKVMEI
jgi:hypothetical protein